MEKADQEERNDVISDPHLRELLDGTALELRDVIAVLIERREAVRDETLKELTRETETFLGKLQDLDRKKLREELQCFRDVLRLYRQTFDDDGRAN